MEATDGAVRFNDKLVTDGALKPLLSCESSARIRQRSAGGSPFDTRGPERSIAQSCPAGGSACGRDWAGHMSQ